MSCIKNVKLLRNIHKYLLNHFQINILFRSNDGGRIIFDDFREAYWWLRENTPEDAKVS